MYHLGTGAGKKRLLGTAVARVGVEGSQEAYGVAAIEVQYHPTPQICFPVSNKGVILQFGDVVSS